ncbi:MAG: cation:proton antiporter [Rhodospirillales bacterium]
MLSLFQLIAVLLTVTAGFAWVNHRVLRLPANIGLLIIGLTASLLMIAVELLMPRTEVYSALLRTLRQIDFYEAVMHGVLAFLLFAGALHVDVDRLRERGAVVALLATVGVALSTVLAAAGIWAVANAASLPVSFSWALVFGALIAPTDPVAVLGILKAVNVPQSLETDMTGEALFNDGVGVVLFAVLLEAAAGGQGFGAGRVAAYLFVEAFGGAALGLAAGYLTYRAMRSIDDYSVEVMLTLALVSGTYALATALHMSGPIAVVVAGVLTGNRGAMKAMSATTKRYVFGFWTLVDDILNAILFLLIGLEVLVLSFDRSFLWLALLAPPLAVAVRLIAVGGSVKLMQRWHRFERGTVPILTWGAIRGGISIALALSLPDVPARPSILAATYSIVIFTVIVQGLSLAFVIRRSRAPA